MLKIKDIEAGYGDLKVLKGVNLEVEPNVITAVIGPNGSGKSTMIKCICGLVRVENGSIRFKDSNISNWQPHKIAEQGISYVPQGKRLFGTMTVLENLEMGAYLVKDKKIVNDQIEEVFKIFPEIKDRMNEKATFLSGGEQQMLLLARSLMIARSLMSPHASKEEPHLLLLDEPSLGLEPMKVKELYNKIKKIAQQPNTTILLVEQNVSMALSISDYFYVLNDGKVVYSGKSKNVNIEQIKEVYF